VLGAIRTWERQGVPVDPRAWRFEQIEMAGIDKVLDFQREHVANRPKLISIVGDKSKIDMEGLAQIGEITELGLGDIFGY
jgi:predicted RNA polymerase sigma factor